MDDYRHYVPVLRWRAAEQAALRDLPDDARALVTPLIELRPSPIPLYDDASRRKYLTGFLGALSAVWGSRRAFIDASLLRPHFLIERKSPLVEAIVSGRSSGMDVVPVVTLPRRLDDPHVNVFASEVERHAGLCLRMKPLDYELPQVVRTKLVHGLLRHLNLDASQVDFVVDEEITSEFAPDYDRISAMTPDLDRWRSFTIISGAFPADLQEFERGIVHSKQRQDWSRWSTRVIRGGLPRFPAYGDYTVQYAAYRPLPFDEIPRPSVSVRYTTDSTWLICRGEAVKESGPGTEQWLGWAQLLKEMPEFKGAEFSAGDRYISERASADATHGNFTTWISAGINHHLTLAARQIASLRAA